MRKIIKDKEEVILREDPDGGFTSIEVEKLTMKMEDLHSEKVLVEMEVNMPIGFRKMPLIAVIKYNIAHGDSMGWKQHQKVLKDDGFDA